MCIGTMPTERPLLLAANHVSWTDIMVLASFNDVSFIAKSEMAGWPLIGWLSRLQRSVFVERDRKRKSGEQASEIASAPGGRRRHGAVCRGHARATATCSCRSRARCSAPRALAIAEGAADQVFIQPVAIAYTRLHGLPMGRQHRRVAAWIGDQDLVPHITDLLAEGAVDVEVHFGEPVAFSAGTSRKEMARQMEAQVRTMMQRALARAPAMMRSRPGERDRAVKIGLFFAIEKR